MISADIRGPGGRRLYNVTARLNCTTDLDDLLVRFFVRLIRATHLCNTRGENEVQT